MKPFRIDVTVTPDTAITKGGYIISLFNDAGDVHLLFEGSDEKLPEKMDELIAALVDMRAAIVVRLARRVEA